MRRSIVVLVTTAAAALCFACDGSDPSIPKTVGPGGVVEWETGGNPDWGSGSATGGAMTDGMAMGAPASESASSAVSPGDGPAPTMPWPGEGEPGQTVDHGILTAGSFDDHLNPAVFDAFLAQSSQWKQDTPDLSQRALIKVTNSSGDPLRASIVVAANGSVLFETTSASDGRALFLPALDGAPQGATTFDVSVTLGGASVTKQLNLADAPWTFELAATSNAPDKLDLAFIVDATGSMGDEISFLKAETSFIAEQVAQRHPNTDIRFGLIVYRDEGDEYVTRGYGFASLGAFQGFLENQQANGGGDYPEAMHTALAEAAQKLPWRSGDTVSRIAFLIADAPPHDDKVGASFDAIAALRAQQVRVYPVAASGVADLAELVMRSSAFITLGRYLFLTDDSGVGNSHAEPHIPCYEVEKLEELMIRMIDSELAGVTVAADPAKVIRAVGTAKDGVCQADGPLQQ